MRKADLEIHCPHIAFYSLGKFGLNKYEEHAKIKHYMCDAYLGIISNAQTHNIANIKGFSTCADRVAQVESVHTRYSIKS